MSVFPGVGDATDIIAPPAAPASRGIINPTDIGVKYFVNVRKRGGAFCAMFFVFIHPLVKYFFLLVFFLTQTGIFLLKQCYYGENTGTFQYFLRYMTQYATPPPK